MPPTEHDKQAFFEEFILCLASRLLGMEHLVTKFEQSLPFSLYWRSKLTMNDTAAVLNSMKVTDNAADTSVIDLSLSHPLLFLDITFSFDMVSNSGAQQEKAREYKEGRRPCLSLVFGAFVLRRSKCIYIQCSSLTIEQLESHVGIDLYSAPAENMALLMAKALDLPPTTIALLPCSDDNRNHLRIERLNAVRLDMDYSDIQETGGLKLAISKITSDFDEIGMNLYCRNLFSNIPPSDQSEEQSALLSQRQLNDSYVKWQRAFEQQSMNDVAPGNVHENTTSNDLGSKKAGSSDGTNPRTGRQFNGYVQVPSKRRKKKTNLYSTPAV